MVGYVFEEMMLQANNTREPTKLEFLEEKHQIILFFSSVKEIFFFSGVPAVLRYLIRY